ncbi:MAG: MobA protein [Bacteroides sp.]|nr:MobA protein [Bacteroides sp.]MBD5349880.1 MobA protein [Bacteroides sp.]
MKQKFNSDGRPPKTNAIAFRCSVNFTASEQAQLLTMQEKSGIASMSSFIRMRVFGKPFKVFVVDENTSIFIDKMSSLNAHYRTIAIDCDLMLKTLRENFTEKKAMAVLAKLERHTIELVKTNRELVALARQFDDQRHKDDFG